MVSISMIEKFCCQNIIMSIKVIKVLIILDLRQRQKSAYYAENITDLPKTLQMSSLCCFVYNLESQDTRLVDN